MHMICLVCQLPYGCCELLLLQLLLLASIAWTLLWTPFLQQLWCACRLVAQQCYHLNMLDSISAAMALLLVSSTRIAALLAAAIVCATAAAVVAQVMTGCFQRCQVGLARLELTAALGDAFAESKLRPCDRRL